MASRGQHTSPITSPVHWAIVVRSILDFFLLAGFEPYNRALHKEHFFIALIQHSLLVVPFASLQEHPTHIQAVLRWRRILILYNLEVKC